MAPFILKTGLSSRNELVILSEAKDLCTLRPVAQVLRGQERRSGWQRLDWGGGSLEERNSSRVCDEWTSLQMAAFIL